MTKSNSPGKKPTFAFGPDAVICTSEGDECWRGPPITVVAFAVLNGLLHYVFEFAALVGATKRIALPATVCTSPTRLCSALAAAGYLVPSSKLRAAFGDALWAEAPNTELKIQLCGAGPEFIELSANGGPASSPPSSELVTPAPQEKPPNALAKLDVHGEAAGHQKLGKATHIEQVADAADTAKDRGKRVELAAARAIASAVYSRIDTLDRIALATDPSHAGFHLRRQGLNRSFVRTEVFDEAIGDAARRSAAVRGLADRGIIIRHEGSEYRKRTIQGRSIGYCRVNLDKAREYVGSGTA
jgi:hypothetical protein